MTAQPSATATRATVAPLTIPAASSAAAALDALEATAQGMAIVTHDRHLIGVITAEDLRFALDWAGAAATTGEAMTLGLVELGHGSDVQAATDAYCEGLRRWISTNQL